MSFCHVSHTQSEKWQSAEKCYFLNWLFQPVSTRDPNINEIGAPPFKLALCQCNRWVLKLSVDNLCLNLQYCQVDKVLNKKSQKRLSVGLRMPYPCVPTLPHHSSSLLRLWIVSREITVKPCAQVITWQNIPRQPASFSVSHLSRNCSLPSLYTCNLNHFYWNLITCHFFHRKTCITFTQGRRWNPCT